ncbi:unnamed protein product [Cuscuta epithymum]|uniref:Uncharacterized protein n=1 Tax=Cuscuta epithymum TaxID=186058 RepID=A0AAV0D597_9ASTE|nr:unnamed protein product [Cuscuta epithymum]
MDIELFQRILGAIENHDDYFTQKVDAVGKPGLSPLQKILASMRMLAYGCAADILDEYVQIGESTTIESLKRFCDAIIDIFEKQYLRKPDKDDVARLLKEGEDRGFPGETICKASRICEKRCRTSIRSIAKSVAYCQRSGTYVESKRFGKDYESVYHFT